MASIKINRRPLTTDKAPGKNYTTDSFTNFMAKLGMGTDNLLSYATYSLNNLISRNRTLLEAGYRSSWLIGQAVDVIAEDMTKAGISMLSDMSPDAIKKLQVALNDYSVWEALCDTIKWSRLYGGAIGVIMLDGADYEKPLNLEAVGKNTFKGLLVLDRWMCEPDLTTIITAMNKDFGKPEFYRIHTSVGNAKLPQLRIHYSRIIRFDGIKLPYYQKLYENHWGLSVVERIYDRLVSYDSSTLGASQMLYKAYLRVIGVKGLREALALGGKAESAVIKQFDYIRQLQTNEGITLLDGEDTFSKHEYSFSGIEGLLTQFGQQISGAIGIPLVRLFGQSPSGFSTGDTDLRNYYDNILREQENKLRPQLSKLLEIMSMSILGQKLPDDFEYTFNSLWQMSDKEKSEIAQSDVTTINNAFGGGLIGRELSAKELLQSSRVTGRFTNITTDDIKKAKENDENEPPPGMPFEPPPGGEEPTPGLEGEERKNVLQTSQESEENPEVSLKRQTPEEAKAREERFNIKGKEQSTNLKEKEVQTDEPGNIPIHPGMRTLGEIIASNIKKPSEFAIPKLNFKGLMAKMAQGLNNLRSKFLDKNFKEEEHPRVSSGPNAGEFASKGGGGGSASKGKEKKPEAKKELPKGAPNPDKGKTKGFVAVERDKSGKLIAPKGKTIPPHIAKLYVAPAWTNVVYNPDPNGDLLLVANVGKDNPKKGYVYSDSHKEQSSKALDLMERDLNKNLPVIDKQLNKSLGGGDKAEKQHALMVKLLNHTGIRIGSTEELLGKEKAYGASTMEARHVFPQKDGSVVLNFIGKWAKENTYKVTDPYLAKTLTKMKSNRKPNQKMFEIEYVPFLTYVKGLDGGGFTAKDFRTRMASSKAREMIKTMPAPTNPKEYKKAVNEVAIAIGKLLNDTKSMALKNYIVGSVWNDWKKSAKIKE